MPDTNLNTNVEPPNTPDTVVTTATTINFEDLVAKARQDEKSKLYPQIEKLKAEVTRLTEKLNNLLLSGSEKDDVLKSKDDKIAELETKIAELEAKGESSVEKDKVAKDLEKRIAELEKALSDKDAEIAIKELEGYRKEKIQGLDESVLDLVNGSTKEEIDASVEKAKALFDKISSKLGTKLPDTTAPNTPPVVPKPNVSDHDDIFKDTKVEDIMSMNITTPEGRKKWDEMRGTLGLKQTSRYKR